MVPTIGCTYYACRSYLLWLYLLWLRLLGAAELSEGTRVYRGGARAAAAAVLAGEAHPLEFRWFVGPNPNPSPNPTPSPNPNPNPNPNQVRGPAYCAEHAARRVAQPLTLTLTPTLTLSPQPLTSNPNFRRVAQPRVRTPAAAQALPGATQALLA